MNLIDNVVSFFNPASGLKRMAARQAIQAVNTGYGNYGANTARKSLLGWISRGGSAKEDIIDNVQTLRERTRDLYMGVPLASGAVNTCRTNVVGSGLRLKSQIDGAVLNIPDEQARKIETQIEREFALWADSANCDVERLDNFYELQQLAFLNWLISGDVLVLLPVKKRAGSIYDLRIQMVEADRVQNPHDGIADDNMQGGVETGKDGEVVAYHIRNTHPLSTSMTTVTKWTRVEAYGKRTGRKNVLHLMNRWRIGQLRGVPYLSPVIEMTKQLGRYTEAEITAAVVQGFFGVFIEQDGVSAEAPFGDVTAEQQRVDPGNENTIELAPGLVVSLNEGEHAKEINPSRPNANFDGFVVSLCRQMGAALELPYELLVKNFTSSYSASRGALLEAWKMFRMYRSWLSNDFCQPVYEEWLAEAVAKGRISAPGFFSNPLVRKAYSKAEWNGPAQGQLDPLKEVNAAVRRITNGLSTRERESIELNGSDFYRNTQQLRQEQQIMKEVFGNGGTAGGFPADYDTDKEDDSDDEPEKPGQVKKT
jgi:lambda family phage portal protein